METSRHHRLELLAGNCEREVEQRLGQDPGHADEEAERGAHPDRNGRSRRGTPTNQAVMAARISMPSRPAEDDQRRVGDDRARGWRRR